MSLLPVRSFGNTGMQPAALALGAAFLHGSPDAIDAIQLALELGFNFLDTYPGHHEEHWGKALAGVPRSSYYLQAKIGTHPDRRKDYSADGTRWSVEQSLRATGADYLDSVLVHDPPDIADPLGAGRSFDVLLEMKQQGIVRNIGLGARPLDWHKQLIESGLATVGLTFLDYTLISQSAAETLFPVARRHGTGMILASAQGMGLLTGEKPDTEREKGMYPGRVPRALRMWEWCQTQGVSIRHFAIQFCLAAPVSSIVMIGPSNKAHVQEAYDAATQTIPDDIWQAFEAEFGVRRGQETDAGAV